MSVNFFFNEFFYDQIYDYIDNNDENYLINGIFLTKIEKTSHDFKTIINDNSNEENELLRQNKKYFDDTIRHEFPKLFIDNIPKNLNLDKSISYPIERLLFHHNNTNFDLNIFFSKNFTNLKNKKINIFYGGEYRLTESLTFLYFLFLIYNLKNNDVNIFYKDRKSALEKYLSIENFLNKKIISNQHIENNSKFEKKFSKNLIWIEGLRQREYWINNLKPLILGCSNLIYKNSIDLKIHSSYSFEEIALFNNYKNNNVDFSKLNQFEHSYFLVRDFYTKFTLNIIYKRLEGSIVIINKSLNLDKSENLFTPPTPLLESIAIVNEMKIRNKKIFLIPHSTTPSHEFHPDLYHKQFTFVKSKKIMPCVKWNSENSSKEFIISENFFKRDINNKYKNNIISKLKKSNFIFEKFNLFQNYKKLTFKTFEIIYDEINYLIQKIRFKFFIKNKKKIGLVLNVEIYETLLDIDYKKQNKIILSILKICIKNNCLLLIRRKPGWTNYKLLKKELYKEFDKENLKKIVFCSDKFSINEYFNEVSMNLFLQGSTAIFESIRSNKPCLFLTDKNLTLMNEQYVEFPENIVPKISLEKLEEYLTNNSDLINLLKNQKIFIDEEMEINKVRIESFDQLKT